MTPGQAPSFLVVIWNQTSFKPLTPVAFCLKHIFGNFQPVYEPEQLQSTQKGIWNRAACLSFHLHRVL